MSEPTREELVSAIERDDPNRSGCAFMVENLLVAWHGTLRNADAIVFQEVFKSDRLIDWQEELLQNAPHVVRLGCRSHSSYKATHAVSYLKESPFTRENIALLQERFGII